MKPEFSRSEFISFTAGIIFLIISGKRIYAGPIMSDELIGSAQKRQEYTLRLLHKLCTDLGPRPTGSKAYAKGAKIIMQEMKRSLVKVNYDTYEFENWVQVSSSDLIVGGQHIEAVPQKRGAGTQAVGVIGIFAKNAKGFSIIDELSGQALAIFSINQYGKAISGSSFGDFSKPVPVFGLGKQDVPLLDRYAKDKLKAWIRSDVRSVPKAKGINVLGQLSGKSRDEILIIAHADTIFNTPGANDNTASVITMLMLAHAAASRENHYTLAFVASDSEELSFEGAIHYAENRIADHTMNNIRYVLNFDSLTYGPNLWISSKDQDTKDLIRTIHSDLNINATPVFDDSDGYVMDSEPFRPSGAIALHANSRGYDEKTLPVYHRPDDSAENVPLDCVEIGFRVFDEFIQRLSSRKNKG